MTTRIPKVHAAEFASETREKTGAAIRIVILIGFLLFPVSTLMDWVSYPQHYPLLSLNRFSTWGALGLLLLGTEILKRRGLLGRYAEPLVWAFIAIVCASMDLMSLTVGGAETPYYAGLSLLLVAILVALPWSYLRLTLVSAVIIVQYDLAMVLFDPEIDPVLFFSANYFFVATAFIGLFWTVTGYRLRQAEFAARKQIEVEKARSEALLLNVLPREVADELKANGRVDARHIEACSILFTDFVGFTRMANAAAPADVVRSLDAAFTRFDAIATRWGLEKLKTIGDSYMAASGVLGSQPDHLVRCVLAGMEMQHVVAREGLLSADGRPWAMRIGIHSGPVVAGVIGQKKFAFDLWGDTVNTASRLESIGTAGSLSLATPVFREVAWFLSGTDLGEVPIRGKDPLPVTRVERIRPEYAAGEETFLPGPALMEALAQRFGLRVEEVG
jgi:class 3 adenylate cyclase